MYNNLPIITPYGTLGQVRVTGCTVDTTTIIQYWWYSVRCGGHYSRSELIEITDLKKYSTSINVQCHLPLVGNVG